MRQARFLLALLSGLSHCRGSLVGKGINRGRYVMVDYGAKHPLLQLQDDATKTRRLQEMTLRYEPIRIQLRLDDLTPGSLATSGLLDPPPSEETLAKVIDRVIKPAARFLEDRLRLVRSVGDLKLPVERPISRGYACFTRNLTTTKMFLNQGGATFSDTDLVVTVRAHEPDDPNSQACFYDQFDRPIFASVDLSVSIFNATESDITVWYRIMVHEMLHILGISSSAYAYWYDSETGHPRTPRPLPSAGGCGVVVPSETTLRVSPATSRGPQHHELVTPTVLAVVRNQFNCSRKIGGRLENFYYNEKCYGDHFDSRWFQTEMMSDGGQMSTRNISPLSFAALEDTGWYLANYSDLEPSPLGRGASCEFLFQDCLGEGGVIPTYSDQLFCNYEKFAGCAPNHMSIAMCSLRNLTSISNDTVPAEYDYFDNTAVGAKLLEASDYCPTYMYLTSKKFGNVYSFNCTDPSGNKTKSTFEVYGPRGRCVESSLPAIVHYNKTDCTESLGCPTYPTKFNFPLCMDVQCNVQLEAVEIRFGTGTQVCEYDAQEIEIPDLPRYHVKCPPLSVICADHFCPKNCAGRGICDYSKALPRCTCNDRNDPSPFCANSQRFSSLNDPSEVASASPSAGIFVLPPSMVPSIDTAYNFTRRPESSGVASATENATNSFAATPTTPESFAPSTPDVASSSTPVPGFDFTRGIAAPSLVFSVLWWCGWGW